MQSMQRGLYILSILWCANMSHFKHHVFFIRSCRRVKLASQRPFFLYPLPHKKIILSYRFCKAFKEQPRIKIIKDNKARGVHSRWANSPSQDLKGGKTCSEVLQQLQGAPTRSTRLATRRKNWRSAPLWPFTDETTTTPSQIVWSYELKRKSKSERSNPKLGVL